MKRSIILQLLIEIIAEKNRQYSASVSFNRTNLNNRLKFLNRTQLTRM